MKRKTFITAVLALGLIVAMGAGLVSAQGGDGVTFNTSWTFQNLGTDPANVHVDLWGTDGQKKAEDDIIVEKSAAFWAPDYNKLDPVGTFNGSIVASSSEPLAATVNQVAQNTTTGRTGNATYGGFNDDMVASEIYAPTVMKGLSGVYWTEMSIQSTATVGDVQVNVHYYGEDGTEVTGSPRTYTVHAGSATRVAQEDESILPSGWIGSAKVAAQDGTTKLAVIVNEFDGRSGRMYDQFYSYEGFATGVTRVVVPNVFINGYGGVFNASAAVQNLGDIPAEVTWYLYDTTPGNPNPNTICHQFPDTISVGRSVYFPFASYADKLKDCYLPGDDAWVGTLVLESTNGQPLVAMANELSGKYRAASFRGLMGGSTELYYPMAFVKAFGFADTSFAIADMSGTSGDVCVTVDYIADTSSGGCPTCSDWSDDYCFSNQDNKYQPDHIPASVKAVNGSYVGAIKITVTTAGKTINGVMNELMGPSNRDTFTSFNGTLAP